MIFHPILEHPDISQKQISRSTDIPVTTLRWHLARLQKPRVITFEKNLNITCYLIPPSFAEKYRSIMETIGTVSSLPFA
ncbi:winged helix-turn-helix transcriptional regulator [Methanocorpusculum petauri]|uniref:winged helix-turn-helix transcriptional regulator n=1 Tax=Methanocorpusculum petauri TaxID=3002863 RepID=UPI003CCBE32D